MNVLPLGIRLVITLPTLFFLFSQILRYILRTRTMKELLAQVRGWSVPKWIFTRDFRWEFFIESAFLSMANGLILIFELARIEYGIILLIVGVVLSLCGLVATEVGSKAGVFMILLLVLLFLGELSYFFVFGFVFIIFGFTLLPRHIFFIPTIFLFILILVAVIFRKKPKMQTGNVRQ